MDDTESIKGGSPRKHRKFSKVKEEVTPVQVPIKFEIKKLYNDDLSEQHFIELR